MKINNNYSVDSSTELSRESISIYLKEDTGKISTPNFGDTFDQTKFDYYKQFTVDLANPYERYYDYDIKEYVTDEDIKIEIEYDIDPKYECISIGSRSNGCLNKTETKYQTTIATDGIRIYFSRNFISKEEVDVWANKRFTGLNVTWHCENCTNNFEKTLTYERNQYLRR